MSPICGLMFVCIPYWVTQSQIPLAFSHLLSKFSHICTPALSLLSVSVLPLYMQYLFDSSMVLTLSHMIYQVPATSITLVPRCPLTSYHIWILSLKFSSHSYSCSVGLNMLIILPSSHLLHIKALSGRLLLHMLSKL